MPCTLCHKKEINAVSGNDERNYFHCANCALIFADPAHQLDRSEEKKRYETHENSIENEGYVTFLNSF